MKNKFVYLLLVLMISDCNAVRRKFHYFMDMAYQPTVDTQRIDLLSGRIGNMLPPENTIPNKFMSKRYNKTIDGNYAIMANRVFYQMNGKLYTAAEEDNALAGTLLKNPLPDNDETVARGKERFTIYCVPCHGERGKADGLVQAKWEGYVAPIARVKPNESVRAENFPEGRIFMVMTAGINSMPSYASQIPESDRWAIAKYVKRLQAESRNQ